MDNYFRKIIVFFGSNLRRGFYEEMQRIASGWDPQHLLPKRNFPFDSEQKGCSLKFSSNDRHKLVWNRFICGQGH